MTDDAIHGGYADTAFGQIHYREAGEGPPLVLLHHSTRSSDVFREVLPLLGQRYRALALDMLGFGMSSKPAEEPGLASYVGAVIGALDALGIGRFALFGYLTGATLALDVAATVPDRVERLILSSCPDFNEDVKERWVARGVKNEELPDGNHLRRLWIGYAEGAYRGWGTTAQVQRAVIDTVLCGPQQAHFAHLAVAEQDTRARVPLVTAPTLLLYSTNGTFAARQPALQALFQRAEHVEMADCGPLIMQEQAEAFCAEVMRFLDAPAAG